MIENAIYIVIALIVFERVYSELRHKHERDYLYNIIDEQQKKLIARSLGEYEALKRPAGKVTNPLMNRITSQLQARGGVDDDDETV